MENNVNNLHMLLRFWGTTGKCYHPATTSTYSNPMVIIGKWET